MKLIKDSEDVLLTLNIYIYVCNPKTSHFQYFVMKKNRVTILILFYTIENLTKAKEVMRVYEWVYINIYTHTHAHTHTQMWDGSEKRQKVEESWKTLILFVIINQRVHR